MRKTKIQIKPSIDLEMDSYLKSEAKRLNKPYGVLVNDALVQYFDLDSSKNREAILLKRLDQLDRKLEQLNTNLSIFSEAFAIFIKTYFARLSIIPKEQSDVAHLRANDLFNEFLKQVQAASLAGNSLFNDLPKEDWNLTPELKNQMDELK